MNCPDCLQNCDPLITDRCVKTTIPANDALGVCKGASLYEWLSAITSKTDTPAQSEIIDISLCSYISSILGNADKSIKNISQALATSICNINTSITNISQQINAPYSFNTYCLSGDLSSRDKILQAVITKECDIDGRLSEVESTYIKQADLCTQVAACLASSASTQYKDRMVPYAPIPYVGPLSNFDNTGKGLASKGFDKVYLMNGLNGTTDWRGRSPIGAIQNVPGATLDNDVNPALLANSAYNYTLNGKYGKSSEAISVGQIPAHIHSVNDLGHSHYTISTSGSGTKGASTSIPIAWSSNKANGNQDYDLCVVNGTANAGPTNKVTTGITINSTGGGAAHNNLHPVAGCYFIVHLP